jgi:hypothetical protein
MAAMIDLPVTPMSESIQTSLIVLLDPHNLVVEFGILWLPQKYWYPSEIFGFITFELRNTIQIWCDCRHFEFFWAWLNILRYFKTSQKSACNFLPIGENRMKNFQSVPKIRGGGAAFDPPFT